MFCLGENFASAWFADRTGIPEQVGILRSLFVTAKLWQRQDLVLGAA